MKLQTTETGLLAGDPIGTHVTLQHEGQTLLGEVVGIRTATVEDERMRVLSVRYFNGEPWPIEPYFLSVDVLERVWEISKR